MRVSVLYFAAVRQRLHLSEERVEIASASTVGDLINCLVERHPALASLRSACQVAVNQEFAPTSHVLRDGDEVALIPPVSGGADLFAVRDEPLSLDEVVAAVKVPEHGGLATFSGLVRNHSRGKTIVALEYEAYRPMAVKKLAEIGADISARYPGLRLAIVHRVGKLEIGDAAVVIAASAPHRKEAFAACQEAIDRLKESVPIWKKEIATDGEVWIGLGP